MAKQFLLWFVAALVGGLLALTIGSYVRYGGPPPKLARALFGASSPQAERSAQKMLRADAPPPPAGVDVLKRGDVVPASLTLVDLDGKAHTIAQYRGRRVLLNFWATWCHPCRKEMPLLSAVQRRHGPQQVRIIGVAMDQPAAVRQYLTHTPVDYLIVKGLDVHPDLTVRFNDTRAALPYSVLIGADGRIQATHLGKLDAALLKRWLAKPHASTK
ncbi:MAG TPA: TlpA disulfide reductase family protein [Oleiagrimonas sp.]|nr:TlpA disulfide reductase family protein [Oleiagrimonas sp.]